MGMDTIKAKNPTAVAIGRLGGLKGGPARAKKLSPERRKEIAAMGGRAVRAYWNKKACDKFCQGDQHLETAYKEFFDTDKCEIVLKEMLKDGPLHENEITDKIATIIIGRATDFALEDLVKDGKVMKEGDRYLWKT